MKKILESFQIGLVVTTLVAVAFLFSEPALIRAIEDQHTITQTIVSEISFLIAANDVTMSTTIGGLTGGTSYGTTTVAVLTNDTAGYTMTIKASTSPAMEGNNLATNISDYTPAAAGVPDYNFTPPGSGAEFGYSVSASTTADLAQKFLETGGTTCNAPGGDDAGGAGSCWYGLSTTATSTILRTSATSASGSTSSVYYRVYVAANATLEEGSYTATTTLTATTN